MLTASEFDAESGHRPVAGIGELDVADRSGKGAEETSPIVLTVLERNLVTHLMRFESQIRGAWQGADRKFKRSCGPRLPTTFVTSRLKCPVLL